MNLTEEQLKAVEDLAYALFTPSEIAIAIVVRHDELKEEIEQGYGEVWAAYQKGLVRQKLELHQSIIKAAHNGSNPAQMEVLKMFNRVMRHAKYE